MSEEQGHDQAGHPVRDVRTGKFQAGVSGNKSGRPKGAPSLASTKNVHLRDQIIEAARLAGMEIDPSCSDGVTAYLYSIAMSDKKAISLLPARVLPIMPTRVALLRDELIAIRATTVAGLKFKAKFAAEHCPGEPDQDVMESIIDDLLEMEG